MMRWVGGRGALRALPAPAHTGTAKQWPYERSADPRRCLATESGRYKGRMVSLTAVQKV
jgi:hypothetical protein